MATTIVCTPGGASDNCYVTLAQATTYFSLGLREEIWDSYPTLLREQALIQATQDIEALGGPRVREDLTRRARFIGGPYDDDATAQALHFPRTVDYDTAVVIPDGVKWSVCEQAWWLLAQRAAGGPLVDTDDLRSRGVQSLSVDGTSVALRATSVPPGIAPKAWHRIQPFVRVGYPTSAGAGKTSLRVIGGYHA